MNELEAYNKANKGVEVFKAKPLAIGIPLAIVIIIFIMNPWLVFGGAAILGTGYAIGRSHK